MRRLTLIVCISALLFSALAMMLYSHRLQRAKAVVQEEDRHTVQQAIHSYTIDKGKPPERLDDLVEAGYLKAIPADLPNLPTQ